MPVVNTFLHFSFNLFDTFNRGWHGGCYPPFAAPLYLVGTPVKY